MDFLLSFLTVVFVALLIAAALTFGFVLIVWFAAAATLIALYVLIRQWWERWRFLRANKGQGDQTNVIDVHYTEISSDRKEDI